MTKPIILKRSICVASFYYKPLLEKLKQAGAESRLVGGCVRDALLGRDSSDIDIATNFIPERVIEVLEAKPAVGESGAGGNAINRIFVVPTGLKFGTVTAVLGKEKFEITSLRKDIKCDGRHVIVEFTDDFGADAARRDFTINALSYDPFEEKIYDYFGGIDDLNNKRVRFIGDPADRITEDYLRILRFFRFSCYYAKRIDQDALKICASLKDNLKKLSMERVKAEMDKLLLADNSPDILQVMQDTGILQILFEDIECEISILRSSIEIAKKLGWNLSLPARYGLLFKAASISNEQLIYCKFSWAEIRRVIAINHVASQGVISIASLRALKRRGNPAFVDSHVAEAPRYDGSGDLDFYTQELVGRDNAERKNIESDIITLRRIWYAHQKQNLIQQKDENDNYLNYIVAAVAFGMVDFQVAVNFVHEHKDAEVPVFEITGKDLLEQNFYGQRLGNMLEELKNLWIKSNFTLSKVELIEVAKEKL